MITVNILINGEVLFARTAVNRLKEHECYILDSGERIFHNPDEGAVALAIKMLHSIEDRVDELSLCENCYCMTKTWHNTCTKCKAPKPRQADVS